LNGLVICNPNAGRHDVIAALERALQILRSAGWTLAVRYTTEPGDATRFAQEAASDGADVVLVAGGDGTLNEAVQSLAHSDTALGYLPCGTVNIWAREICLPLEVEGAAHAMLDGRIQRVDLGIAGERYFLLMAGIGFDGEVVRRARSFEQHKRRLGILPYVVSTLVTAPLYRGADVELRYDGIIRRVQALMLVVGNTRLYGGYFRLTPNAVVNDGWLDLCVIKGKGFLSLARQSLPILLSRSVSYSDAELLRVKDLTVRGDAPLPLQVDGELIGTTPVQIGIAPKALHAIIPSQFNSDLIA